MTLRFATTGAFNSGLGFSGNMGTGVYNGGMNNGIYGSNMIGTGNMIGALESRDETLQAAEGFDISRSGRDAILTNQIANICTYLSNGQEDYALEAYNELLNQMAGQARYEGLTTEEDEAQLRAVAKQLIESELGGDLEAFIRENTRDAKGVQKQQQMYGADKVDSVSTEDLLFEMCDIKEHKEGMKWYDQVGYGFEWFFNPWERWFAPDRVD